MDDRAKAADRALFLHDGDVISDATAPVAESGLLPVPVPRKPGRKAVTTLTLSSRTCKWPIGDPVASDFHYCGSPPQSGRPYCDEHDRMSYQATPRKKGSPSFR